MCCFRNKSLCPWWRQPVSMLTILGRKYFWTVEVKMSQFLKKLWAISHTSRPMRLNFWELIHLSKSNKTMILKPPWYRSGRSYWSSIPLWRFCSNWAVKEQLSSQLKLPSKENQSLCWTQMSWKITRSSTRWELVTALLEALWSGTQSWTGLIRPRWTKTTKNRWILVIVRLSCVLLVMEPCLRCHGERKWTNSGRSKKWSEK